MAFTTKLATRYWLKTTIVSAVCIVLGLWGVWDYVVAIPQREESVMRSVVLKIVHSALSTERGSVERDKAGVVVRLAKESAANKPVKESVGKQMDLGNTAGWIDSLELFQVALSGGDLEIQSQSVVLIEDGLNQYGSVTPPSKYDRPMQWAFILCIPFGFYYLWVFVKMSSKAKIYNFDDQGGLTTPEGYWTADEITDIDMSKWIAPTGNARATWTATVITSDKKSVLLDDYIFEDMHLIIGSLAHRFYPQQWAPNAKRVVIEDKDDVDTESRSEDE